MDCKQYATEEHPIRASMTPQLMRCALSGFIEGTEHGDAGSKAADTGSAVHMAASIYHGAGQKDTSVSIAVMRGAVNHYPFADLDAAEVQFRHYAADPRNQKAEIVLNEEAIQVRIAPAKDDPTQKEIVINGKLDQVRKEGGELCIWDIKTGGVFEGLDMLHAHMYQIMVYQIGASLKLKIPVRKGGVIRTKDYLKKTPGVVFWKSPWRWSDAEFMMKQIAARVARIRRGELEISPSGEHCRWCPLGGVGNCVSKEKELRESNKV